MHRTLNLHNYNRSLSCNMEIKACFQLYKTFYLQKNTTNVYVNIRRIYNIIIIFKFVVYVKSDMARLQSKRTGLLRKMVGQLVR